MIIDIKQYLKETNTVLVSEQAFEYLKEKASAIEKLEAIKTEMDVIAEIEKIKDEIIQVVNEEKNHDEKWALGLRYSVKIMDNHIAELKGGAE